ncbi:alcohol dehydrogenase catalytic domain-containing protein [Methylorubrum salsuginis]|uniref:Alcohol dehydrogenase GroES-like domain-containing protein n=1 Tax=Methylorubrum salsuginis TaxID=414703 RepID=A0A1I4L4I4_9HYPH|nr:alcohol dehydrogenase catalytic domain-containing protein [Methylorubrum salsuginis]SFL85874.1 Alcohol dehydrogenase GroES-like domain-containing protein [Methylorubrum salsuginis]
MRAEERAVGAPAAGMVKLTQEAIGFNDLDVLHRNGLISRDVPGRVMGIEAAGTVTAVGPGVDGFAGGDRVGYLRSQSQASRCSCRDACTVVPPDRDCLPFHAWHVPHLRERTHRW